MRTTSTPDIPEWNLDTLYTGIDSPEYKKSLADYTSGMDEADSLLTAAETLEKKAGGNFDFPAWLSSYLEVLNKIAALRGTLAAYAYIIYSVDTTNIEYLNNLSHIEELGLRFQQLDIRFSVLLASREDCLESFFSRFLKYENYRYILHEIITETHHLMTAAEENLASDMQRTGGDAWGRLHEQIISNLHDADGKTFNGLRNDAYSPDALLRRSSWEKEITLLKQNEIAIAAALSNLKGETVMLNKRRRWDSAVDRALSAGRMEQRTLDSLIGAIEDSLPLWREYLRTKAAFLRKTGETASTSAGTERDRGIAFYDLFAPLPDMPQAGSHGGTSLLSKKWTFAEAREYVLREYYSFSTDMGDFAKRVFENGWIDAGIRAGKVGGAYDEDFALGHQSRILTNFTGAFSDIITLAHEIGHAYHFSCMKGKDALFFNYPMTLAETASTFAETIVKQDAIRNTDGFDKIKLIETDLQDVCQVLVDILCRYYFEKSVFEERSSSELNSDAFCRLMRDAQQRSYGDGLNGERHEYMWAVKSHYYSTSLDFYNFPYAFGQLFAAGLYRRAESEGQSFAGTYAQLLSDTGSMSCEDLCRRAGFEITSKEFWNNGISMYAGELKTLTANLQRL
ncbi:MAG TPA: peptidase M3 [Treponema sp.]|nr:peptidase M3 [Treponema sp.]